MSDAAGSELLSRAKITLGRVRTGVESRQAPIVTELVEIIREITSREDTISVNDLAECISREPSTMARLLSIANALGYNPSGVQITSIRHAIAIIGFERVRSLAVSILLLENAQSPQAAAVNRELAGLSLLAGLIAANRCRQRLSLDPDLAFVCGALRGYGRMLMATFMTEEYAAVTEAEGIQDVGFRTVFGLTPLELGREHLASMQLPPAILQTFTPVTEEMRSRLRADSSANLLIAVDFGARLAETIQSPDLTGNNYDTRIISLSREYDKVLHLSKESANELLNEVASDLRPLGLHGGFALGSVPLFRRLEALVNQSPLPPPMAPRRPPSVSREISPPSELALAGAPADAGSQDRGPANRLLEAMSATLEQLARVAHPDLDRIFRLLTEALRSALELDSCLIFVQDSRTGLFHFYHGTGPLVDDVRDSVYIDPAKRHIFSVPIKRGEDAFIEDPEAPSILAFVPSWLRRPGQVRPILLLPIKDDQGAFALVCATGMSRDSLGIVGRVSSELRRVGAQLAKLGRLFHG
jgi:HDOD domain